MRIGLFLKKEKVSDSLEKELINKIISFGHEINNENPEIVFSIGGDGTFLKSVQRYIDILDKVKFICINKGNLGYFSDFGENDFDYILSKLNSDELVKNSYRLVSARINGEKIFAINEIRIENPFHTFLSEVYVNDTYLETFRGNGLSISTNLGSTAYNKSLGGAVIDSDLEILQLSEIAPINNCLFSSLKSPLVIASDKNITLKGDFKKIYFGYDHLVVEKENISEVNISLSDKKVHILNKVDRNFIKRINECFVERREK